jgi:hypothetical protein
MLAPNSQTKSSVIKGFDTPRNPPNTSQSVFCVCAEPNVIRIRLGHAPDIGVVNFWQSIGARRNTRDSANFRKTFIRLGLGQHFEIRFPQKRIVDALRLGETSRHGKNASQAKKDHDSVFSLHRTISRILGISFSQEGTAKFKEVVDKTHKTTALAL